MTIAKNKIPIRFIVGGYPPKLNKNINDAIILSNNLFFELCDLKIIKKPKIMKNGQDRQLRVINAK